MRKNLTRNTYHSVQQKTRVVAPSRRPSCQCVVLNPALPCPALPRCTTQVAASPHARFLCQDHSCLARGCTLHRAITTKLLRTEGGEGRGGEVYKARTGPASLPYFILQMVSLTKNNTSCTVWRAGSTYQGRYATHAPYSGLGPNKIGKPL